MKFVRGIFRALFIAGLLSGCAAQSPPPARIPAVTPARPFNQFVDESFKALLRRDPELVTILGVSGQLGMQDDQLTPLDETYLEQTRQLETQTLESLRQYDRAGLSSSDQQVYDTYEWYLDDLVRGHAFANHNYLVSQMIDSPDQVLIQLFRDQQQVRSAGDARAYLHRLGQLGAKMEGVVAGLETRRAGGVILPRFLIDWTLSSIEPLAINSPRSSPFFTGLEQKLAGLSGLPPEEKEALLKEAEAVIRDSAQPGFRKLADELELLKRSAPREIGIGSLPGGGAYYAYLLRHHTTTGMSAEEIHQLGISELESIHAEMRRVFNQLGYPAEESLPRLYQRAAIDGGTLTGAQVFDAYTRKIGEAKTQSAELFNLVPKSEVIVQPDVIGGFYMPPSLDGSRPGIFYASTGGNVPEYAISSLVYHETIPGHHTQLALAGELGLPLFQTVANFNGYTEGWALYAERLMAESGVYEEDPYGYLGYLQYAARRAARLVIDTGIHARGWNFDQATRFMVENTGMSERESQYEAARMAVMPGQAVSYYIGLLKILELRERAKKELGEQFDLRGFHDAVLKGGPAPLPVLENAVERWVAESRAR